MLSGENRRRASGTGRAHRLSIRSTPEIRYGSNGFRTLTCVEVPLRSHSILSADTRPKFCAALVPSSPNQERPSLTFLLIGWFSPAEEAKRPICSGFLRFRPERKGVYTNRPGNGPTEECEKSVLVEDPGASGCARSGAGLPDEAFRRFARDSSS